MNYMCYIHCIIYIIYVICTINIIPYTIYCDPCIAILYYPLIQLNSRMLEACMWPSSLGACRPVVLRHCVVPGAGYRVKGGNVHSQVHRRPKSPRNKALENGQVK